MKMRTAQKWLIAEWLILGLFLLGILVVQWLLGKYGDKSQDMSQEAFNWFGAMIAPTLTLMLGVGGFVAVAGAAHESAVEVEKFPFFVAFAFSLFYLIACLFVVLGSPFTAKTPLTLLKDSETVLHYIQGLSGLTLGWFFGSNHKPGEQAES